MLMHGNFTFVIAVTITTCHHLWHHHHHYHIECLLSTQSTISTISFYSIVVSLASHLWNGGNNSTFSIDFLWRLNGMICIKFLIYYLNKKYSINVSYRYNDYFNPHLTAEKIGTERLDGSPKVTQLLSDRNWKQTPVMAPETRPYQYCLSVSIVLDKSGNKKSKEWLWQVRQRNTFL